ncbi:uncharacterized protein LOC110048648 [Orbicella faveolata]|uniref:uncharacterized protein LOC110048648 n=1 Tax=Orbicella faveolata TaxID=48498 RepID=UPI0009E4A0AF|nr:uncharacterized protein LOC110048648 [Orbicella faveolata]
MERKIKSLEEANKLAKEEKNKIEQSRDKIKKENKKSADFNQKLMKKKRDLEKENDDLTSTLENITKEHDKIKAEHHQLLNQARHDCTEMERLKKEVDEKETRCRALEEEIIKWRTALKEEIIKCRTFEGGVFIPKGNDFDTPGVICALKQDNSDNVIATRSSDGPGNADDVLIRKGGKTCGTAEIEGSWWRVYIGENYLLFLTHCSLRHGKIRRDSILRHWELQGSIDGKDWKKINTKPRTYDQSGNGGFVTGTWSVKGNVGAFRHFRILQTGRHSSGRFGIYLSGIEFYGVLMKV